MDQTHKITRMLRAWSGGNYQALEDLMPLVYEELHRQAYLFLSRERRGHTLQTTALIHETYLKLIDQREVDWESRTHFFAIAAKLMRRILVDYARAKYSEKRGGRAPKLPLEEAMMVVCKDQTFNLLELDEALTRLEKIDRQQAQVVECRYFSGLSLEETADVLNISRTTVATDWRMARAWLHRELTK